MASKPTLGSLLINPQKDDTLNQISHENIHFPKINIKLKKSHFTKYRSAFINLQPQKSDHQSKEKANTKTQSKQKNHSKQLFKKLNTEAIQKDPSPDLNVNSQIKKNPWKLNKKHDQSYTIQSIQSLNLHHQSADKEQKADENTQRREKLMEVFLNESQMKKNQKFTLLTEIRQLNISPIQNLQVQSNQVITKNKHKDINQNIERSNRMISLIEKNYKKGFFQTSNHKDSSLQKLEERLGLFSYLKRQFVTKRQQLTSSKLNDYFKSPSNKKLQAKINYSTRQFLKDKLHNDYHSYKEVNRLRENLSTNAINQEMKQKSKDFNDEYNKKYNVPYMSFLSLPKNLKIKVLQNLTKNTNRTERGNFSSKK